MALPWQTLATISTPEGPLELRRRGDDWLMVIGGRVLMNSYSRRSEEALAHRAVECFARRAPHRMLVSGLGMGFTLRALLDRVGADAKVVVVEINPTVVEWCRGPLAEATNAAVADPRVQVEVRDVADVIGSAAAGSYDLILLDLYEGPNRASQRSDDPFYGANALARTYRALAPGGVLAVWSEDPDAAFERRLATARFTVTTHSVGNGGRRHIVYLGAKR